MYGHRIGTVLLLACALLALHTARSQARVASRDSSGLPAPAKEPASADTAGMEDSPGAGCVAIGAGIGSPAGISFTAGGYFTPVSLRVSGGYWGVRWNGFQGDIGFLFNSSPSFAHGLSVIAGVFRANPVLADAAGGTREADRSVHYVGAAYDAWLSGFYLQVGIARGRGDYPNPQLVMQFGYMFAL